VSSEKSTICLLCSTLGTLQTGLRVPVLHREVASENAERSRGTRSAGRHGAHAVLDHASAGVATTAPCGHDRGSISLTEVILRHAAKAPRIRSPFTRWKS